ncbi:DUF5753 domain-containing protein [Saccharopolyspora sp. NPDC000995]
MTLKDAAKFAGLTSTRISRIGRGKQTILSRNVRLLRQCYNIGAPLVDTLIRLPLTPEYAAASLELVPKVTEQSINQQVEFRRPGQDRVKWGRRPDELRVALDEAALRRKGGGTDAMLDQIRHLLEPAERTNITNQVVAFDVGAYLGMHSPFHLLRFAGGFDDMDAVYLENQRGAVWMEHPTDINYYIQLFERMTDVALASDETADSMDNLASSR